MRRRAKTNLHRQPLEHALGDRREALGERWQQPRAGLDQQHAGVMRLDLAEVPPPQIFP